ncbi:uncharacterized membrane protein YcaP (DUF421 family) [Melghiribacillus thermohalophilus]|uniref:Uncharacterized membrane protein YcaP (DUF421 family) n=1 Tax=Melghiribacillus thermohalophilus TaxID=1324956 RepID=A0A4V2V2Z2_9BACI|nr:DUF421 domain-containing protein [Melghiribacillus thermohalophilus]TCT27101.1 uncharacterized membrane protein YcaP (DUF421 family) [Melghiribacillus thermohalophilus]
MDAIVIWGLIYRTVLAYIILLLIFRLMGKREVGELGIFDLVIFIMLAEMAVFSIEKPEKHFLYAIVPMIVLLMIQRFTAFISLKNLKIRRWIDGKPSIIIHDGKIDEKEMKSQRYNIDDLLMQLRDKGVQKIQDVDLAVLEANGKLSVFEKKSKPIIPIDPLIEDGKIIDDALHELGKDKQWLKEKLKQSGYVNMDQISYCTVNDDGSLYVDLKETEEKS